MWQVCVVFILMGLTHGTSDAYNRSVLQKAYPGFGEDFIIFPGENGQEIYGYFGDAKRGKMGIDFFNLTHHDVGKDLTFTLYTRNIPRGKVIRSVRDLPKDFDNGKKTKFVTHGWLSTGTADTCIRIKDGFLNKSDVNVFVMDWSPISGNIFYPIPMEATTNIGEEYSKFLNNIITKKKVSPEDIHLIGHSLGAHVSGFAGRRAKGKIGRITGLDPAMPGFTNGEKNRLNSEDAHFVDIIHTCAGFLGIKDPIGHADFYPNGGSPPQPGCGILKFIEACSHGRSWKLFANSITLKLPYLASRCKSNNNLSRENCYGEFIPMGEPVPTTARGIYYIETTEEDPYLKYVEFIDNNSLEK